LIPWRINRVPSMKAFGQRDIRAVLARVNGEGASYDNNSHRKVVEYPKGCL